MRSLELLYRRVKDTKGKDLFEVINPVCSGCGSSNIIEVDGHRYDERRFTDIPRNGIRPTKITVKRRTYKCNDCGKAQPESLPEIPEDRKRVTKRLLWYIVVQVLTKSRIFKDIADEVGVDKKTVGNIFSNYITALESMRPFETPKLMQITNVSIKDKPRPVIFNIRKDSKKIINVLESDNQQSLANYLKELRQEEKSLIEFVAIDMVTYHRNAIEEALPDAKIVIDKSHVLKRITGFCARKASKKVPKENKYLISIFYKRRNKLNHDDKKRLTELSFSLRTVYDLYQIKEQFCDIWSTNNRHYALSSYRNLEEAINRSGDQFVSSAFKELFREINAWRTEVFRYFELPCEIPDTKELEERIHKINRLGYGYSFEVLRAMLIFGRDLSYDADDKVDEYGFKAGNKQSFMFSLLSEGKYTRREIIRKLDEKYPNINNRRDLSIFKSDLRQAIGKYPHSRGVKVGTSDNGIVFISCD